MAKICKTRERTLLIHGIGNISKVLPFITNKFTVALKTTDREMQG
jgi:hypothetical protein